MPEAEKPFEGGEFARDVLEGLSAKQKHLKPKYFYDAAGSELFEEITRQPEYYLTRTETAILHSLADGIGDAMGDDVSLVELGSGSSVKTTILLESLLESQGAVHYLPIDISPTILKETADRLDRRFPSLEVTPIASQYEAGLSRASAIVAEEEHVPDRKLVLFLGSSIGNLEPEAAIAFLNGIRTRLDPDDALLIGFDLIKDVAILDAAYDDAAGVTARFNLNLLARINRELGGEFHLDRFSHSAFFNASEERVEMHLKSSELQRVPIRRLDQSFRFEEGETIHTENSYKYTRASIQGYARASGFRVKEIFTDEQELFALALFGIDGEATSTAVRR